MPYTIRCLAQDGTCRMQAQPLEKPDAERAGLWQRVHEYAFPGHRVAVEEVEG